MVIIKALAWALSLAAVSQCESCPVPRCHENGQDSTGQE